MIYIFGAGGFGREVAPLINEWTQESVRFVVDGPLVAASANDFCIITSDEFMRIGSPLYVIAIGDPTARQNIDSRLAENASAKPFQIISSRAHIMQPNRVEGGLIVCAFASVHPNCRIGRHVHLNIYSYVAHDAVIGDFVTLAPKAAVNGHCRVGDGAYIGTGAMLREGIEIGAGAVVGMGAVVTKDVPPGAVVAGNPARPLQKG